jgi:uncharacterized protein YdaU (DUF1376 family)
MSTSNKRRAPAFQFYADDFLAGTLEMSQAEVGAYIRLLCHQWNRGSIPVEPEKQQRLAGGNVSVDVLAKFDQGEDGLLRNQRLESVRTGRNAFTQQQREKGLKSALARAKAKQRSTEQSTAVEPEIQPDGQPNGQPDIQPEFNSPSPSPIIKNTPSISPWVVAFGVELPESLRTENCLEAVKLWLKYKSERREGYKQTGLKAALTKWSREFNPATFPSAVDHSMAQGWKGIFAQTQQSIPQIQQPTVKKELDLKDWI